MTYEIIDRHENPAGGTTVFFKDENGEERQIRIPEKKDGNSATQNEIRELSKDFEITKTLEELKADEEREEAERAKQQEAAIKEYVSEYQKQKESFAELMKAEKLEDAFELIKPPKFKQI